VIALPRMILASRRAAREVVEDKVPRRVSPLSHQDTKVHKAFLRASFVTYCRRGKRGFTTRNTLSTNDRELTFRAPSA
jgi:hypothetical protein